MIARAFLKDAEYVILDEATAFADPENEVLIQKALNVLCQNRTVIMIAHRLSTVINADKIIVLDKGYVIEEGTHDELLNKKSGILGISGVSSDFRDVLEAAESENERAKLALEIFYYKVRTQIAAYAGAMGGVDVIVFTAGIGENSSITRRTR